MSAITTNRAKTIAEETIYAFDIMQSALLRTESVSRKADAHATGPLFLSTNCNRVGYI